MKKHMMSKASHEAQWLENPKIMSSHLYIRVVRNCALAIIRIYIYIFIIYIYIFILISRSNFDSTIESPRFFINWPPLNE